VRHKTANKIETHAVNGVRQKKVGDVCKEFMKFSVIQKKLPPAQRRQQFILQGRKKLLDNNFVDGVL
jgi:hypothetical protein